MRWREDGENRELGVVEEGEEDDESNQRRSREQAATYNDTERPRRAAGLPGITEEGLRDGWWLLEGARRSKMQRMMSEKQPPLSLSADALALFQ
jgi:hypothetical protein